MTLGEQIRQVRRNRGMTQKELGMRLGCPENSADVRIAQYETGQRRPKKERLEAIPGTPPNMIYPPVGDAFAPRNKYAMKIDFERQPPMFRISDTHYAATWLLHPDAPKVDPPKAVTDRIARMKQKREEQKNGQ